MRGLGAKYHQVVGVLHGQNHGRKGRVFLPFHGDGVTLLPRELLRLITGGLSIQEPGADGVRLNSPGSRRETSVVRQEPREAAANFKPSGSARGGDFPSVMEGSWKWIPSLPPPLRGLPGEAGYRPR